MRGAGLLGPLCLFAACWGPGREARAQVAAGGVDVEVMIDASGRARVEERWIVAPAPTSVELRALMRPCAEVGDVRIDRDGERVPVVAGREGPWLVLRDGATARRAADTLRLLVRYDVALAARRAAVPLVFLTEPLPQRDGAREGSAGVLVRFRDPSGAVHFPHLTRAAPDGWMGRFVAVPSLLEVSVGGAEATLARECADPDGPPGDDGGLLWRFLLFVGIMVVWVPVYLRWAGRSREEGA